MLYVYGQCMLWGEMYLEVSKQSCESVFSSGEIIMDTKRNKEYNSKQC